MPSRKKQGKNKQKQRKLSITLYLVRLHEFKLETRLHRGYPRRGSSKGEGRLMVWWPRASPRAHDVSPPPNSPIPKSISPHATSLYRNKALVPLTTLPSRCHLPAHAPCLIPLAHVACRPPFFFISVALATSSPSPFSHNPSHARSLTPRQFGLAYTPYLHAHAYILPTYAQVQMLKRTGGVEASARLPSILFFLAAG